jgi:asparagine synthase (glutamine-hydrolysing)
MLECMIHEPWYASGYFCSKALDACVGWVHHTGLGFGEMPVWSARKDLCLVFCGEVFATEGKSVSGPALLSAYEERGIGVLAELNGYFCGVLVDLRTATVVLFNDRYGLGRVYVHENEDGLFFASEAKALLRVLPSVRTIDFQGLGELLTCGCTLEGRSLFRGVALLPPGSAWELHRNGGIRKRKYFEADQLCAQAPLPADAYYQCVKSTLERIIPVYIGTGQQVGLSLTGGVDSRMVLAGAKAVAGALPCYTFSGMVRECEDARVARIAASVCGQKHTVLSLTPDFFRQFTKLAREAVYRTDGCMDVTGATSLYMNRMAREIAPIRLTGNYGGEILRGLVAFRPRRPSEGLFCQELVSFFRMAEATYEEARKCSRLTFIAFKQVPWHHYGRFALEQSVLAVRTPFLDNALVTLVQRAPQAVIGDKAWVLRLIGEWNPGLARIPTDRGFPARLTWLPRGARRFLTEFLPRVEYVFDYGMPQWLARMEGRFLPHRAAFLFLGIQKYAHFRVWYRDHLASVLEEVLLDPRAMSREYLNAGRIEPIVRAHLSGRANYTREIHALLTLELIMRELVEGLGR